MLSFYFFIYFIAVFLYILAHKGIGYQYIWSNYPYFNRLAAPTFTCIGIFASLQLIRFFFDTKHNLRYLDKWLVFMNINILISLFFVFFSKILSNKGFIIFINYTQIFLFLYPVTVLFSCLYIYVKTKNKDSLLFLASFMFTLIAAIIITMGQIGVLKNYFIFEYLINIAAVFDLLLLLFVLLRFSFNVRTLNQELSFNLLKTKKESLENILRGQEQERQRLSQALHDGASLQLATLQMKLSHFGETTQQEEKINPIIDDLDQISVEIRNFSHALSPVILNRYGLIFALEDLLSNLEDTHTNIQFDFDYGKIEEKNIAENTKRSLYAMVLELLQNALKYAQASQIKIILKIEDKLLTLIVQDDGKGYDPQLVKDGIGLQNIQDRANLLGGNFTIEKRIPKGMKHRIEITS